MSGAPTLLRQFQQDVDDITAFYAADAGVDVALRFVDDLEALVRRLTKNPQVGSSRYSELGIPGLRSMALASFPYVLFFAEVDDGVAFWRILHGRRDIPPTLQSDTADDPLEGC